MLDTAGSTPPLEELDDELDDELDELDDELHHPDVELDEELDDVHHCAKPVDTTMPVINKDTITSMRIFLTDFLSIKNHPFHFLS